MRFPSFGTSLPWRRRPKQGTQSMKKSQTKPVSIDQLYRSLDMHELQTWFGTAPDHDPEVPEMSVYIYKSSQKRHSDSIRVMPFSFQPNIRYREVSLKTVARKLGLHQWQIHTVKINQKQWLFKLSGTLSPNNDGVLLNHILYSRHTLLDFVLDGSTGRMVLYYSHTSPTLGTDVPLDDCKERIKEQLNTASPRNKGFVERGRAKRTSNRDVMRDDDSEPEEPSSPTEASKPQFISLPRTTALDN